MVLVYVSSTYSDLPDHREAVRKSVRRMGHEDVAMEYYVADDQRPLDRCLADVRRCDLYVVVVAFRYGFVPDGYSKSITELEYEAAVDAGKPVLAFVMSDSHPWPFNRMEGLTEVKRFRDELMAKWVVGVFTGVDDLARQVTEALQKRQAESAAPLVDWEVYRHAVVERHQWVRLSVIAGTQDKRLARIPLDDVFVPQQLQPGRPDYDVPQDEVVTAASSDALRVLGETRRQVVLGGPGSGKSTLFHATMLALCDQSIAPDHVPSALRDVRVPLLVELRQYALSGCSDFLVYLEKTILDTFSVRVDVAALTELLTENRALVLFDGLDEIFEPSVRAKVVDQFAAFSRKFPDAHVLVSSRIVGYDETELGLAGFEHFTVLDFGLREISEFVPRWYEHYVVEGEDRDAAGLIRRITDNPRLLELAGNPLLLTMMAIIYQHHDLPERRSQLYARCTGVLLEDWDVKRKKIDSKELLKLDFTVGADQKVEILQRVAVLMLTKDDQLRELNAIRYEPLCQTVADYLEDQYNRPPGEARALAKEILNHLRERTHILAETGDGIFGFVHRTFMEYFAAGQVLAEFNRRKADYRWLIDEVYLGYRQDDRWREPLLLLSGMLAGQGSPTREVVDALLKDPDSILFAAQCLGETGQVESADRTWAGGVLSALIRAISASATKRRADGNFVEEAITAFGRVAAFMPVTEQIRAEIGLMANSSSIKERAAAWQLDGAFGTKGQRRRTALGGLGDRDAVVRQAAISMLEREWPGDEEVFACLVSLLRLELTMKVRESALGTLSRGWPRRSDVLKAFYRPDMMDSPSHALWLANHLVVNWSGNKMACRMLLELAANARPGKGRGPLLVAVATALVIGWRDQQDSKAFFIGLIEGNDRLDSATICVLIQLDIDFALGWFSVPDEMRSPSLASVLVRRYGYLVGVLERLLELATRRESDHIIAALVEAATRYPGAELALREIEWANRSGLVSEIVVKVVDKSMKRFESNNFEHGNWLEAMHVAALLPDERTLEFWNDNEDYANILVAELRIAEYQVLARLAEPVLAKPGPAGFSRIANELGLQ